jgi:L-malate glycosyltransferase
MVNHPARRGLRVGVGPSSRRTVEVSSSTPVRVCLVAPSLDIMGGQAVQADRLRRALGSAAALDVEFLPVNPRAPGPIRWLQRVKYARTVVTSILYAWSLLVRTRRYDVLHVFSASYFSFILAPLPALLAGRLFRKPTILNYRSGEAEDHLTRWKRTALPGVRLASSVVVPSGYLVDVFRRFGIRAEAIANFVDVSRLPHRERLTPRPVLLSNRNFESLYDVATTLRAFGIVQREYPDAALLLAGAGREEANLRALAASLELRNVTWHGALAPEAMGRLYDAADIYVNASTIDNMPTSIIEAFAAGLPVATTDAGGIPYLVANERTGLLAPACDPDALASAVFRLLREPGLAHRLAAAARAECEQRYTWSAVRDQWEALYRNLARPHVRSEVPGGVPDRASRADSIDVIRQTQSNMTLIHTAVERPGVHRPERA